MRFWPSLLLCGAATLPLLLPHPAAAQSRDHFAVTVHRGVRSGNFNAFGEFHGYGRDLRLPSGRFEGFCCVAVPGDNGEAPGIVVINAVTPPPPPPPPLRLADLHMTVENTPAGVTVVRGPAILP